MNVETLVKCVLLLGAIIVLGLMVNRYNLRNDLLEENFYEDSDSDEVIGADENDNEQPEDVKDEPSQKQPVQCYPRDTLSAAQLLPNDAANSAYAQVNPSGQGDADSANYLTAGSIIGINTVGTSNRNANLQVRSEPPNSQLKVSPWNQTTIDPDLSRRPLE